MLYVAVAALAFQAGAPLARTSRTSGLQMANIADTLAGLEGPEIFWGSEGVAQGHDEDEIKGHDGFGKFVAAAKANGVDLAGGDYTVLAPADSAFVKHEED